jgi:hypothetical protein
MDGDAECPPDDHFFAPYAGWKDAEGMSVVRFEDIIGPRGGGRTGVQLAVLPSLAGRIGWQGDPHRLLSAIAGTFNPNAGTFRRGTIDGWRDGLHDLHGTAHWRQILAVAQSWGYLDHVAAWTEAERASGRDPVAWRRAASQPHLNDRGPVESPRTGRSAPLPGPVAHSLSSRSTVSQGEARPTVLQWLQKLSGAQRPRRRLSRSGSRVPLPA